MAPPPAFGHGLLVQAVVAVATTLDPATLPGPLSVKAGTADGATLTQQHGTATGWTFAKVG